MLLENLGGKEFHPLFLRSLYIINIIQTVVLLSTEFTLQTLKHVHHISDDIKSKLLLKAFTVSIMKIMSLHFSDTLLFKGSFKVKIEPNNF